MTLPVRLVEMWQQQFEKLASSKVTDVVNFEALANESGHLNSGKLGILKRKAKRIKKHQGRKLVKDEIVAENRIKHKNLCVPRQ